MSHPTPVRVIFRTDRYGYHAGTPIAVFDDLSEWPMLGTYEHVGQHGHADPAWLSRTRAATPAEYAPLLAELAQRGYVVTVGTRLSNFYRTTTEGK